MSMFEELKNKTPEELAMWQARVKANSLSHILAETEWKRRSIEEQHNFNRELFEKQADLTREMHEKQTKTIITISKIGAVATILAALIGSGFGFYLSTTNLPQLPLSEPKRETTILGIKSPEIQAESVLKNVSSPNPPMHQTANSDSELN